MKEYIEREAVLAYPIRKDHCDKENANEHFIFGIESVIEYIENLPAADVAPVRHAVKAESTISKTGLMCTACYSDIDADAVYCKYCGALMDGKEDKSEVQRPKDGQSV